MDRWYNTFKELIQDMQYVEVWNSVMMQCADEVEGEDTILSWEHHPWINAVLNEYSAEVYQVLIRSQFETLLKFAF